MRGWNGWDALCCFFSSCRLFTHLLEAWDGMLPSGKASHVIVIHPVEKFLMWVTARLRFQLRGCCESRMGPSLGALIGCTSCRRTSLDLQSDHEEDLGAGHAVGQNIRHATPHTTLEQRMLLLTAGLMQVRTIQYSWKCRCRATPDGHFLRMTGAGAACKNHEVGEGFCRR